MVLTKGSKFLDVSRSYPRYGCLPAGHAFASHDSSTSETFGIPGLGNLQKSPKNTVVR
jgi:hypothetical protein